MSEQTFRPHDEPEHPRDDGFGTFDRTAEQQEVADVDLDQPDSTDDVPWSPPDVAPIHAEFEDDSVEETIDQRIAQEEPEQGTAYGAPEPGGVLGGADDLPGDDPLDPDRPRSDGDDSRRPASEMAGGDDPDAIPAEEDVLDGPA